MVMNINSQLMTAHHESKDTILKELQTIPGIVKPVHRIYGTSEFAAFQISEIKIQRSFMKN